MTDNMHHHHHGQNEHTPAGASQLGLAHSANLHCLLGCGVGEVAGVIIGTALALSISNIVGQRAAGDQCYA